MADLDRFHELVGQHHRKFGLTRVGAASAIDIHRAGRLSDDTHALDTSYGTVAAKGLACLLDESNGTFI